MRTFRSLIINLVKIIPFIVYFFYKVSNPDSKGFAFWDFIILTFLLFLGQGISAFLDKTLDDFNND